MNSFLAMWTEKTDRQSDTGTTKYPKAAGSSEIIET